MEPRPEIAGRIERRKAVPPPGSVLDILRRMPALVLLERLPMPILAVSESGTIAFANNAFAVMIGLSAGALQGMKVEDIIVVVPVVKSATARINGFAGLVEFEHADGSTVAARSKSLLVRNDDIVALTVFEDVTEQLWSAGW